MPATFIDVIHVTIAQKASKGVQIHSSVLSLSHCNQFSIKMKMILVI